MSSEPPMATAIAAVEESGHHAEEVEDERRRHEPPEGEDVAVGEVDQLQDPVDERVAGATGA